MPAKKRLTTYDELNSPIELECSWVLLAIDRRDLGRPIKLLRVVRRPKEDRFTMKLARTSRLGKAVAFETERKAENFRRKHARRDGHWLYVVADVRDRNAWRPDRPATVAE